MAAAIAGARSRIHILGLGSIGTFAAHAVSEIPSGPSICLLMLRQSLLDKYNHNGGQIKFESRDAKQLVSRGYDVETLHNERWYSMSNGKQEETNTTISNLIVCVKATQTVSALRALAHRLTASSNILFLQNGAGMMEEVSEHLFPNTASRPNYMIGAISHGVTLNLPFNITHTGFSASSIGPVPRSQNSVIPESQSAYMREFLPKSPTLSTTSYSYTDILQLQLEKLSVNAFCNPICALNDAKNEFLFSVPETRTALMAEISQVVLALPELRGVPDLEKRFSVHRLEQTVDMIIKKTAKTTCSMVWDLRAGRETEINFINGSWSRMGRRVGVSTPVNDDLVHKITERHLAVPQA